MNILMINLPFAGHTNPTFPLTAELVKRGHHVTYINAEPFRKSIEESGAHLFHILISLPIRLKRIRRN